MLGICADEHTVVVKRIIVRAGLGSNAKINKKGRQCKGHWRAGKKNLI